MEFILVVEMSYKNVLHPAGRTFLQQDGFHVTLSHFLVFYRLIKGMCPKIWETVTNLFEDTDFNIGGL